MVNLIGITRCLALSGVTDYSFVDEEAKWRGSEVHRVIELAAKGTLDRSTVPNEYRGYLRAHDNFILETGFVMLHCEKNVQNTEIGVRGRIDRAGLMKGKDAIIDFKSSAIQPAVALQLCLGGHLLEPGKWFHRYGVQLKADGSYSVKVFPLMEWAADLSTARSCAVIARWKVKQGMV